MWLSLFLLAFAVSMDGFGVGMTFGMKNMKIPYKSIAVISLCSAFSLATGTMIGDFIGQVVSREAAEMTGGIILILLGAWMLVQYLKPEKPIQADLPDTEKLIFNFEIKSIGVAVNILQKPMSADFDRSGTINGIEALVLGFALSLDAFGAGIGAAMAGFSPFILAVCIAVMSFLFIWAGLQSGRLLATRKTVQHLSFLPGIMLILIGIWKI